LKIKAGFACPGKLNLGSVLKGHDFSRADNAIRTNVALATEGCLPGLLAQNKASFRSLFSPCGNARVRQSLLRILLAQDSLNCSALHLNGVIVSSGNHLRFEEDDKSKGAATAVSMVAG
jgi:hypothetical protein